MKEMENKKSRYQIIKGTKCETCYKADYCWNALKESDRSACLGPFKDLEDFKEKFRASNEEEAAEKEREQSAQKYKRWSQLEEYRINRMLCDLLSSGKSSEENE
jgi:hypothetical protein